EPVTAVKRSDALVLIITGAGKAFSGGVDLESLKALIGRSPGQNLEDSRTMAQRFRTLHDFRTPTIAPVNGPARAGGTGIAATCGFRVGSAEAKFGYAEVRIGFVPANVSTFLIHQVGEKHARDLLLTGRIFGAEEAYRMGLVNEVVAPENLMQRATEIAQILIENSPASLRATKALLSRTVDKELDAQIEAAVIENAAIRQTQDFREGIISFLEKRKPVWTSK